MRIQYIIGVSAMILMIIWTGCNQDKKSTPDTPAALLYEGLKSVPSGVRGVTSDLQLFEFLNSDNIIVRKLSEEAKEQLMNNAQFELRGCMNTGHLYEELSDEESGLFNNYLYKLTSMRSFILDLKSPTHPLKKIFDKLSAGTRNNLITSAVGQFHGFNNERLLRKELTCQEYEQFYRDLMSNPDNEIVWTDQNCVCKKKVKQNYYAPDGISNPPCQKTKTLQDYKWNGGSTWTKSDCDKYNEATCVICDNGGGTEE